MQLVEQSYFDPMIEFITVMESNRLIKFRFLGSGMSLDLEKIDSFFEKGCDIYFNPIGKYNVIEQRVEGRLIDQELWDYLYLKRFSHTVDIAFGQPDCHGDILMPGALKISKK